MKGEVIAVSKSSSYTFHKYHEDSIKLIENLGVEGDVHSGETVKHRSRIAKDPTLPNLRQVHLIHAELFSALEQKGFDIKPGLMGENITTMGIPLLELPRDTILRIGNEAAIKITGLRNPCVQLNQIKDGLMNELVGKDDDGNVIRKAGIMSVVIQGGVIQVGDAIQVILPEKPHQVLQPV